MTEGDTMRTWLAEHRTWLLNTAGDLMIAIPCGCIVLVVGLAGGTILDHLTGR